MKINRHLKYLGLAAVALLLASATSPSQAQFLTGSQTNSFPNLGNTSNFTMPSWIYWYNIPGGNTPMTCNVSLSADNDVATSGCLEVDTPFLTVSNSQNLIMYWLTNSDTYNYNGQLYINLELYTNITVKCLVPQGIPPGPDGNFATVQWGYVSGGNWSSQSFGVSTEIPAAASNGWVTLVCPINHALPGLSTCSGLTFNIQAYGGYPQGVNFTNYYDDLVINLSPAPPPGPPTVLPLTQATPGLNLTATSPSGQYNRYNVLTALPTGNSFVGQPSVTYAWTNIAWPGTNTANSWQQQLFFVAGTGGNAPGNPGPYDSACDWNFAHILWFTVGANADGTAYLQMRCKTNGPGGNGMLFNTTPPTYSGGSSDWPVEPLAQVPATSPLGVFSVTFVNNNNITITTPGGSTNITIDPAWTALFADPMTLALGDQPNAANGYGQTEVISGFGVTGNSVPFSDNFTTDAQLNTNLWRVLAGDPNGVNLVPPGSVFWLTWTLPDDGFSPQTAGTLTGGPLSWVGLSGTVILNNNNHSTVVPQSALQGVKQNFFRLIQRTFNGLQVLLPGETAAPGTPTGKTGTPTVQDTTDLCNVTVNAVDTNGWYVVPGVIDSITITSSDGAAILPTPAALVNSTGTYQILFQTDGTNTVTATDTSVTPNISGTSSIVTVSN